MNILKTKKFRNLAEELQRLHEMERGFAGKKRDEVVSREAEIAIELGRMMAKTKLLREAFKKHPPGIHLHPQDTEHHPIAM